MRTLAHLLDQPVRAGKNPPQHYVWHASIRNHPTDRTLTDTQWAHIATEILAAVGIAPHTDPNAARWVAIRHADNHIHLVATLVRQDGNTIWAWNERLKAQTAARDLEQRYGLHRVSPPDHTSHRRPTPAEQNKTLRLGHPQIPRDRLRHEVRAAAAVAIDEADFFHHLHTAGILVRPRHSTTQPDQTTGYAVGLLDHQTSTGDTIWYGGGRLASDLTLPQLRRRWRTSSPEHRPTGQRPQSRTAQRTRTFQDAASAVHHATDQLANSGLGDRDGRASALADGAADLLTTTARAFEGRTGGPLTDTAEAFDKAVREPHHRPPHLRHSNEELRSMARLIATMGRLTADDDTTAALHLLLQIAMLADNLANLREAQGRLHQAQAARQAANQLRTIAAPPRYNVHPDQFLGPQTQRAPERMPGL